MEKIDLKVNLEDLNQLVCSTCSTKEFAQYCHIFHASPLVSPTGKDHSFVIPKGFLCVNCGGLDTAVLGKDKFKVVS